MRSLTKSFTFLVAAACLFVLTTASLYAHSSGASFEQVVNDYRIDVGYDPISIVEGDRVVLDFELWNTKTEEPVPYSRIWTRIEYEGKTVFATGIGKASLGATSLLFHVLRPGEWVLHVRYESEFEVIAEASFPFTVAPASWWAPYEFWIVGILAGLGGVVCTILFHYIRGRGRQ